VCTDLMKEIADACPAVAFAGFVMDSAAANRAGMALLNQQREALDLLPPVNLQGIQLLLIVFINLSCRTNIT
jgi:hypothetical protein